MAETWKEIKSFTMVILFATAILILMVSLINVSKHNIVGRAFYGPTQIYGEIEPDLPDGTKIIFKIDNHIEIASSYVTDNKFGYDPEIRFKMDDPSTLRIEGYSKGDKIKAYIEGIDVVEWSYFEEGKATEKDIIISPSKREEIILKATESAIERNCMPEWKCSSWSICKEGIQTRECKDMNSCGTDQEKPDEQIMCTEPTTQMPANKIDLWKILLALFFIFLIPGFFVKDYNNKI